MRGYSLCSPNLSPKYTTSRFLNLRMKYRSSFEVIASILETVKGGGAGQYSIITQAGITHLQFKKYLESLAEIGFIETMIEKGKISYRTNKKGLDFLDQYYVLLEMLSGAETSGRMQNMACMFADKAEAQSRPTTGPANHWMR